MNRKRTENQMTALYCRLSLEDGRDNESMSISNQKAMLSDYAEKNGMRNYVFYVDDGYTGRNFNRPGFQQMIADIEDGKINCVITKDLSRLGRNYIEAGSYIEMYFPSHHVRYIAINDNVDSINSRELDITPFKNILNDMYSRDISKKVLSGWMARSRQGKFIGGTPPYGLMRDPEDGGHLIIDPNTAPAIKLIYDLASRGYGSMRIAKHLMEQRIPVTRLKSGTQCDINYYYWGSARICSILRNPVYYGAHVVCKTHQKGIRSNTVSFVPREEWEVIEDCHEAIVSKEQWSLVQRLIDQRPEIMKGNACPYRNIFHGIIFCGTCGKSMQVRYEKVGRTDKNRFNGKKREPIDKAYFICQTYNRTGVKTCSSHKIEARDLHNLILAEIQSLARTALENSEAFYDSLTAKLETQNTGDRALLRQEMDSLNQRIAEIDGMFLSLYEDKMKGVISEQRFVMLTSKLEEEQNAARDHVRELMAGLSKADGMGRNIRRFIDQLVKYSNISELDEIVTHQLIEKVIIGEPHMENGEKVQAVKIIYNFVGEIPNN